MGLETGIWASRLGFEGVMKEEKKEKEIIPHMCESIGHGPLRGRCPKTRLAGSMDGWRVEFFDGVAD